MFSFQTIVIIVLVIIAIVLSIWFIVEINIGTSAPVKPFTDGSIVAIRSLANNKFLVPIVPTDFPNCSGLQPFISPMSTTSDAAITHWYLCQDTISQDQSLACANGQAQYSIHQQTQSGEPIGLFFPFASPEVFPVLSTETTLNCLFFKTASDYAPLFGFDPTPFRFYFELIENNATTPLTVPDNAYKIRSISILDGNCNTTFTLLTPEEMSAMGFDPSCPQIIMLQPINTDDPKKILSQSFEVVIIQEGMAF